MQNKRTIHEIPNHPTYGIRVVICANTETIVSGRDIPDHCEEDAAVEAVQAASETALGLLGWYAETDGIFRHWHGGKFDNRMRLSRSLVVADIYRRDEPEYEDWKIELGEIPEDVTADAQRIVDAIGEAFEAALAKADAESV